MTKNRYDNLEEMFKMERERLTKYEEDNEMLIERNKELRILMSKQQCSLEEHRKTEIEVSPSISFNLS